MWHRLRDGYFFDALGDNRSRQATSRKLAQAFLDHVAASAQPRQSALGLGEELEIAGDDLVGGASGVCRPTVPRRGFQRECLKFVVGDSITICVAGRRMPRWMRLPRNSPRTPTL